LLDVSAAWGVPAAAALALTLAAFAGVVIAITLLLRYRIDWRVIEAAERLEAVDLTSVVKRYVPSELQTQRSADEIAVAKQVIAVRRRRWKRIAVISGMLMLCCAAAATYSTRRNLQAAAVARLAAKPKVNLDVLKAIQGVWGWRADFLQSCSENPQTVSVTPDRKKLSVLYAKPFLDGSTFVTNLEYEVVLAKPDSIVLSELNSAAPGNPRSNRVYVQFLDANTFSLSRSDEPMKSSGTVERCPPPPVVDERVAH
jgi:hypothetical protein